MVYGSKASRKSERSNCSFNKLLQNVYFIEFLLFIVDDCSLSRWAIAYESSDFEFDSIVGENWLVLLLALCWTLNSELLSTIRLKCHTEVPPQIICPGIDVGCSISGLNDFINR